MQFSAILHLILLLLTIFGLPSFFHRKIDPQPIAISVDILPIAPKSNVKPQEEAPKKPDPVKPIEEKETAKKAAPETTKVEQPKPTPPPPPPVKPEVPKKIEQPKPPEKPKPEKPKKEVDPLKDIFKSIEDTAKKDESKKPTQAKPAETHKAKSDNYDETAPLSISEIDAIRGQIEQCWNPPVGAKDAANLVVNLHIEIAVDGTVTSVELASDSGRYNSDSFFASAADSAMRAVRKCSPLKNLPADKYDTWKDMTITFDPKNML